MNLFNRKTHLIFAGLSLLSFICRYKSCPLCCWKSSFQTHCWKNIGARRYYSGILKSSMQSQSYAGHSKRAPSFQNKSSPKLPRKQQSRQARCTKTNSAASLPCPGSESCGQATLPDVTQGILQNRGPCRKALHNTAVHCPSLEKNSPFSQ